jgi:hypothetical protein
VRGGGAELLHPAEQTKWLAARSHTAWSPRKPGRLRSEDEGGRPFDGEVSRGTGSHAAVKFTESGDLQLSVQDVGEAPRQFWGDSDYEWWVTVKAQQVPRLLELLRGESSTAPTADDLLALIGRNFGGHASGPSEFPEWLKRNRVPYEFFSYV